MCMVSMGRLRWGHLVCSISGTRTISTRQGGGQTVQHGGISSQLNTTGLWVSCLSSMASDKYLNCSIQRVLCFYFKSCVNRARILQLFSTMVYPFTQLESALIRQQNPRLGKILASWSVNSAESKARYKHEEKKKSWWSGHREIKRESSAEDVKSHNWKGRKISRNAIANQRRDWIKTRHSKICY